MKKNKSLFTIVCLMMVLSFLLPWLHTSVGKVNGIVIFVSAYHLYDYVTVISIIIAVSCICAGLYTEIKSAPKWLVLLFSLIGVNATICAVNCTAHMMMEETKHLVQKGLGNYLMIALFGVMVVSVMFQSIKKRM